MSTRLRRVVFFMDSGSGSVKKLLCGNMRRWGGARVDCPEEVVEGLREV